MATPIQYPGENLSNSTRSSITAHEPQGLRTFTPSQAVLAKSAGIYHWTSEGRRLYDFSSGVLVANLGHNPRSWLRRFSAYMGWKPEFFKAESTEGGYVEAVTMTAYNAITPIESLAVERVLKNIQSSPLGKKLDCVMWAASGSEAIQKALWACLHRDEQRDIIIATRYGFHGKKGLAGAVTGCETDKDRDPRVKFISFPMQEIDDSSRHGESLDLTKYRAELEALKKEFGSRLNCLITEPYIGGGGSYHPPAEYLQLLRQFCRENDIVFILDEVQANFGRCGRMYAFEAYNIDPDIVVLGKGLGNGVPVSAAVGTSSLFGSLKYGEASDTWSANPLSCAAVLATLDEFENSEVLLHTRAISPMFWKGLERLKETGLIGKVRGEREGLVFGIECLPYGKLTDREVAAECVKACYLGGQSGDGIHLLGALAGNVLRISPPLTITEGEAKKSLDLMFDLLKATAAKLKPTGAKSPA
ncbi:MAG: aminotransferase class III-fold pyridoxal phosphate-dependent enzyme [Planctomycetales bacterium]